MDDQQQKVIRLFANQGNANAQSRMGQMYYDGDGVPKSKKQDIIWYRLAAEQGDVDAQGNLGYMYDTGRGVPQDQVQAHMWYDLAVSRATGEAREIALRNRDLTASQLTPADLSEAQRLAREWDAAHPR